MTTTPITNDQKKRFGTTSLEEMIVGHVNTWCRTQMSAAELAEAIRNEEYLMGQVASFLGEFSAVDQLAFAELHNIPRDHLLALARKFNRNTGFPAVLTA